MDTEKRTESKRQTSHQGAKLAEKDKKDFGHEFHGLTHKQEIIDWLTEGEKSESLILK